MRSGQGCRRASWWCWLALIACAAVSLPGARFVRTVAAEPPTSRVTLGFGVNSDAVLIGDAVIGNPKLVPYSYELADLLDRAERELKVDRDGARKHLASVLGYLESPAGSHRQSFWQVDRFTIEQSPEQHRRTSAAVVAMREHGFDQVSIQVRFIWGEPDKINRASKQWVVLPTDNLSETRSIDAVDRSAIVAVEKHPPVMLEVIDDARARQLLERYQQDRRVNVSQAPRMTIFNAQTGDVVNIAQMPFVVGASREVNTETGESTLKPRIRVCKSGRVVRMSPVLKGDTVELDYELLWSSIRDVEHVEVRVGDSDETTQVQVPEVAHARIAARSNVPLGKTLLVGGLKQTDSKGNSESLLMLVKVMRASADTKQIWPAPPSGHPDVAPSRSSKSGNDHRVTISSNIYPVTYPVADLVIPIPGKADLTQSASPNAGGQPEPNFETLVNQITSMVQPASWEKAGRGGRGNITPFPKNLSLVISQEEDVHEKIAELLAKLRKPLREQVCIGFRFLPSGKPANQKLHPLLPAEEGARLLCATDADHLANELYLPHSPKLTVFSGGSVVTSLPGVRFADLGLPLPVTVDPQSEAKIEVRPKVSADRRSVEVTVSLAVDGSRPAYRIDVPDGQSLIVDLSRLDSALSGKASAGAGTGPASGAAESETQPKKPQYLVISPRILIVEDEEPLAAPAS